MSMLGDIRNKKRERVPRTNQSQNGRKLVSWSSWSEVLNRKRLGCERKLCSMNGYFEQMMTNLAQFGENDESSN